MKTKPSMPFREFITGVVGLVLFVAWIGASLLSGDGWSSGAARNLVTFVSRGAIRIASPSPKSREQAEYDEEHGSEGGAGMR
jgi:hypothetical protein